MERTSLDKFRQTLKEIGLDYKEYVGSLTTYQVGKDPKEPFVGESIQSADVITTKCVAVYGTKGVGEPSITEFHFDTGRFELICVRTL